MNLRIRFPLISGMFMFVVGACYAQTMPSASGSGYANDSEGLRRFSEDVIRAANSHDKPKELALINSLTMPPNSTWFTDTFGPAFGPRLSAAYDRTRPQLTDQLLTIFEQDVLHGIPEPKILRYDDPATVNAPIDAYLNCMNKISPLYETAMGGGDRPSVRLGPDPSAPGRMRVIGGDLPGFFVYVDAGFRFMPRNVLSLLPEQRPLRIQLDMNVMKSKIIHRVQWPYPKEAMKENIKGKVAVHLTLDTTGRVKAIGAVDGPSVLADAVVAALKQWTFQPTTLDGDPVEVDFTFDTFFM